MKVAFIGGGNMAEAMIAGVLRAKLAGSQEVIACDISKKRCDFLASEYQVEVTQSHHQAAKEREVVVLAVKPQQLPQVMAELQGHLRPQQIVVSVVAGASLATLTQGLGHPGVVRVMPNINAGVGQAFCLWTAPPQVSQQQRELAHSFLAALGKEAYTPEEKHLDMATAVSGSGPAYIFLIIEALIDAAVHIGLPRELAQEMVLQTVLGSARLAQDLGRHPAELKALVVSPGGTTAEALLHLEEGGLRGLLIRAVVAAYEKAQRLGKG